LDLAFRDEDLVRLTVAAPDLVFALLLVFAAALAFADLVFFLATMRASRPAPFAASLSLYLKSYKLKNKLAAVTNDNAQTCSDERNIPTRGIANRSRSQPRISGFRRFCASC
jgi:hypothetical protein